MKQLQLFLVHLSLVSSETMSSKVGWGKEESGWPDGVPSLTRGFHSGDPADWPLESMFLPRVPSCLLACVSFIRIFLHQVPNEVFCCSKRRRKERNQCVA